MAGVDVLVTAASPFPAQKLAEVPKWLMYDKPSITSPFNVTGLPALATCAGFDAAGMPLSIQIVGKPFADALVLALGDAYEAATGWRSQRPPIATTGSSKAAPERRENENSGSFDPLFCRQGGRRQGDVATRPPEQPPSA